MGEISRVLYSARGMSNTNVYRPVLQRLQSSCDVLRSYRYIHGVLQVYRPLEFLFTIAAFTTLAENFLPQLIALPKVPEPGS